jgi:hypothetical protein
MTNSLIATAAAAFLLAAPATVRAATLKPGDALPALNLSDQHDQAGAIDPETRLVLFTKDMDASEHVQQALAEDGAAKLAAAKAVFVADISRMPAVITRFFALPALRKRPYRMLLDRDGQATANLPAVAEHVTLLRLSGGKIERVEFAVSAEQVGEALSKAAAAD